MTGRTVDAALLDLEQRSSDVDGGADPALDDLLELREPRLIEAITENASFVRCVFCLMGHSCTDQIR
jgi:hypothetical protein